MKIQTFTIVVGTAACNAKCPYCISKMTPKQGVNLKEQEINWHNFDKACRLSQIYNVSTVLFTGKGEPTLYPDQVTDFLKHMKKFDFPIIEIQSNGLFMKDFAKYKEYLEEWHNLGLNTIAISIVHYKDNRNKEIYTLDSEYPSLEETIKKLHNLGFSIRLSVIMVKGYIDSIEEVKNLIEFSKKCDVEQLTLRSVKTPDKTEDKSVYEWTRSHTPNQDSINKIAEFIDKNAKKLMTLEHGATVYDFEGQNICLTDCLTLKSQTDNLRQLIFFPDGHLRYDWQYKGAILM